MSQLRSFVSKLQIVDKNRGTIALGPNMTPAQDRLLSSVEDSIDRGVPVRKVVSKARQMGFSTMTEAIAYSMSFMLPNMRSLIVSHRSDSAAHLLDISRHYWDTYWAREAYTPKYLASNRLAWVETNSSIKVTTAKSVQSARGETLHFLHASECAFWDHPELLLTGLYQAIPRLPLTFQILESTSNGVGNWWYETCHAARDGDSSFDLLFFGWWEHPDYAATRIGLAHLLSDTFVFRDDEERVLFRYLRTKGFEDRDIADKLLWRREIIATECLGDVEKFHQEYPTTLEESFVSTGRNVFAIDHLRAAYEPLTGTTGELRRKGDSVEFVESPSGHFRVFRKPSRDLSYGVYCVAGDPSWAATGDYSTIQVINRNTWEQVAVYRRKNFDATSVGEMMDLIGRWYNDALAAPENTKGGGAAVGALRARQYPNLFIHRKNNSVKGQLSDVYGWTTNVQTKPEAISHLQKALYDKYNDKFSGWGLVIHDEQTFSELKEYVVLDNGQFGNSRGENHDDCVMALAIALAVVLASQGELLNDAGPAEPNYRGAPVNRDQSPAERLMADLEVSSVGVMERDFKFRTPGPNLEGNPQTDFFDEREH